MTLETYQRSRETLLNTIVTTLASDERVMAAWLTGSYARGDADVVSDIDLTVVVADEHAATLCRRAEMVTAWPPAERLQLFTQFGEPANVHENNNNAPEGGTFTSILYQPSAHMVDWILVPYALARRPNTARLLFERLPVALTPPPEPLPPAALAAQVSEQVAFFWMMTAVVIKYLIRGDRVLVAGWLDELNRLVLSVTSLLAGQRLAYHRGLARSLSPTASVAELAAALLDRTQEMETQMALAGRKGITLRPAPRAAINTLMQLLR